MSGMYTLTCKCSKEGCTATVVETGLNEEGKRVAYQRKDAQLSLLEPIEGDLEPVKVVFYSHDVPWQFIGHEFVSESILNHAPDPNNCSDRS
jgi:hypothetical protein